MNKLQKIATHALTTIIAVYSTWSVAGCSGSDSIPGEFVYSISGTYKNPIVQTNVLSKPTVTYESTPTGYTSELIPYWVNAMSTSLKFNTATNRAELDLGSNYYLEYTPTPASRPAVAGPSITVPVTPYETPASCQRFFQRHVEDFYPFNSGPTIKQTGTTTQPGIHTIKRRVFAHQVIGITTTGNYKPLTTYDLVVEGQIIGLAECSLDLPEINLNHGTLNTTAANEHEVTTTGNINCNAETNVKIQLANSTQNSKTTSIPLGDDVYTDLDFKLNNLWSANGVFHLSPGVTPITLRSKIKYKQGTGVFRGSSVLVINVQ
ncbi:hypothetical protein EW445_18035 [Salmonella enterica subsp. enterica serovar Newport]|uniref:Fimbrial adhesin MrpH C-terminal domain-containing protein n=1 Tax=Salmonella enterica subsp. salamae TaxID=59202 RepID=A0A5Y3MYW3_SALER|nr:hypothetical protein [Salmonella enterica subsp. enterica serovar Newport]ECI4012533.1 hypothetical protein [Salmonella enterica subsp. salamae]